MGLDNFKSDDDKSTGTEDETPSSDGEIKEESKNVEETTEQSGLASFKSDGKIEDPTSDKDRERSNPWMDDFTSGQWNDMSTKEKVKYVRQNYYPGYRPEVDLNHEWEYRKVIEIKCECRNTFTFRSGGTCMDCGRSYASENGAVIKKHDPHTDNE